MLSITNFPLVTVGRTLAGLFITVNRTGGSLGNMYLTFFPFDILLLYEVRHTRPQVRAAWYNARNIRSRSIISVLVLPSFSLQSPLPSLSAGPKGLPCYLPMGPMALTREPSSKAGPPKLNTGSRYYIPPFPCFAVTFRTLTQPRRQLVVPLLLWSKEGTVTSDPSNLTVLEAKAGTLQTTPGKQTTRL